MVAQIGALRHAGGLLYSRQTQMPKLLPQHTDELLADLVFQIMNLILIPLLRTRIPPNRTNINHSIPKLHKRAPLDRDIQIRDIMQYKIHQFFVLGLA